MPQKSAIKASAPSQLPWDPIWKYVLGESDDDDDDDENTNSYNGSFDESTRASYDDSLTDANSVEYAVDQYRPDFRENNNDTIDDELVMAERYRKYQALLDVLTKYEREESRWLRQQSLSTTNSRCQSIANGSYHTMNQRRNSYSSNISRDLPLPIETMLQNRSSGINEAREEDDSTMSSKWTPSQLQRTIRFTKMPSTLSRDRNRGEEDDDNDEGPWKWEIDPEIFPTFSTCGSKDKGKASDNSGKMTSSSIFKTSVKSLDNDNNNNTSKATAGSSRSLRSILRTDSSRSLVSQNSDSGLSTIKEGQTRSIKDMMFHNTVEKDNTKSNTVLKKSEPRHVLRKHYRDVLSEHCKQILSKKVEPPSTSTIDHDNFEKLTAKLLNNNKNNKKTSDEDGPNNNNKEKKRLKGLLNKLVCKSNTQGVEEREMYQVPTFSLKEY